MSSIATRPVVCEDLSLITKIAAHYVEHTAINLSTEPMSLSEWQSLYERIRKADHPFFAAFDQQETLLGYCYAHFYRPKEGYRFTLEVSIYLAPDCEGRGIGRILMNEMLQFCFRANHINQLLAVITDLDEETLSPSIAFHQAMGFKDCGRIVDAGYKFDRFYDIVQLQLSTR